MTVTTDDASDYLNIEDIGSEEPKLSMFVDAANEWVASKVAASDLDSARVNLGTLELIRHLWRSQRGPAAVTLDGEEFVTVSGTAYAIPNRVRELLPLARTTARYSFPDAGAMPDPVDWPC